MTTQTPDPTPDAEAPQTPEAPDPSAAETVRTLRGEPDPTPEPTAPNLDDPASLNGAQTVALALGLPMPTSDPDELTVAQLVDRALNRPAPITRAKTTARGTIDAALGL